MSTSWKNLLRHQAHCIWEALPVARRETYLRIAEQHGACDAQAILLAMQLYVWNGDLAAAVDRATGEVEVYLRNFIDKSFSQWNESSVAGTHEWLTQPASPLTKLVNTSRGSILSLAHTDTVRGKPTHHDYVAGLSFGTWVHLLPRPHAGSKNAHVRLWREALEPKLGTSDRVNFQRQAMRIKDMRNRATHRRPLVKDIKSLSQVHRDSVEILRAIDHHLGEWFRIQKWIPVVLNDSPLPQIER